MIFHVFPLRRDLPNGQFFAISFMPLSLESPVGGERLRLPYCRLAFHRVAATTSFSHIGPLEPDRWPYRRYILVKLWTNAHW